MSIAIKATGLPDMCGVCKGKGTTPGVFHDLDCTACDGIGWHPMAEQDITRQLGRCLSKQLSLTKVLQALVEQQDRPVGAERHYQPSPRDGVRGHYTGD